MRILLVEDDQQLTKLMTRFLEKELYTCDSAGTLSKAGKKVKEDGSFDAIILDLTLPDGDGVEFCRTLRADNISTPIIMLTTRAATIDKVTGLDAGADDYMPKPFSPNELKARLRAVLRRPEVVLGEELACGDITLNVQSHLVKRGEKEIELMPKEYSLLVYLMRKKNQVVKKEELLRHVWGVYSRTSSNRLEVYVRYLREKLDIPFNSNNIRTVRGLGYKIADD